MNGANGTISTTRIQTDVNGKEAYSLSVLSSVAAYIEPLSDQAQANYAEENMNLLFNLFLDGLPDILISDLVVDDDGIRYKVQGVKPFKGGEIPSHTEAVILKIREIA